MSAILERVESWWSNWRDSQRARSELAACSPRELDLMAREIGFEDGRDLLSAASRGPEGTALVARMAEILGLDLNQIESLDPAAFRQLQVTCNTCGEKKRCACEIASGRAQETFTEFCPNADLLGPETK